MANRSLPRVEPQKNMRIALVYLGRRGSGGPISYQIATGLSQHAQLLAVLSNYGENLPVWKESGLELLTASTYRTPIKAALSWLNPIPIRRLAEQISHWGPDVLVFPMFYTWNPLLQKRLLELPSVIWVHDPQPHPGLAGRIYRWMENASIRQAKQCVVLSPDYEQIMIRRGARPGHIDVLPHGDLSFYLRYKDGSHLPVHDEQAVVLFFGRIDVYKGLDILLRAWERYENQSQSNSHACLRIIGSGSLAPYQSLLKRLHHVEVINRWVDDEEIPLFFRGVKVVVLPYTSASQSGIIPLAAAFGVPVIATRVGGIPDQFQNGKSGLLIKPESPSELSNAIVHLLTHPEIAERLGGNLREEYSTKRSWESITTKLYQICLKALDE